MGPRNLSAAGDVGHGTMAEAALAHLREAIIHGELAPGMPLPLGTVARALGMSTSPVREALGTLTALGLVEHVPHHGATVAELDIEELRAVFSIRLTLESMALRQAAVHFDAEDARRAGEQLALCEAARRRGDVRTAANAHAGFHEELYEAARSTWLSRLITPVWDSCERFRLALFSAGEIQDRHAALDRQLLEACRSHEPARAAAILRMHLDLATEFYAVELQGRSIFGFAASTRTPFQPMPGLRTGTLGGRHRSSRAAEAVGALVHPTGRS